MQVNAADARITDLTCQSSRKSVADKAARTYSPATIGNEPTTYDGDRESPSFLKDMLGASRGDWSAAERLQRHSKEISVIAEQRVRSGQQEWRDLTRVDGGSAGNKPGPTLYLVDQYVALARAARPTAEACSHFPLPPGTYSINLPKVATGTATAAQTADNARRAGNRPDRCERVGTCAHHRRSAGRGHPAHRPEPERHL